MTPRITLFLDANNPSWTCHPVAYEADGAVWTFDDNIEPMEPDFDDPEDEYEAHSPFTCDVCGDEVWAGYFNDCNDAVHEACVTIVQMQKIS